MLNKLTPKNADEQGPLTSPRPEVNAGLYTKLCCMQGACYAHSQPPNGSPKPWSGSAAASTWRS